MTGWTIALILTLCAATWHAARVDAYLDAERTIREQMRIEARSAEVRRQVWAVKVWRVS